MTPDPDRGLRRIVLALGALASLYGWAQLVTCFVWKGSIGFNMAGPDSDGAVFYTAARLYRAGRLGDLFDTDAFCAALNQYFTAAWGPSPELLRPWVYPPTFLVLVLPLALVSLGVGWVLFQAGTAALLAAALRLEDRRLIPLVLLSPAAALSVASGQNAFLIAALLVGGFSLLGPRPILAGMILGLATVKPQFWLMVPIALVAGRHWRALAGAALSASILVLASLVLFGWSLWADWIDFMLEAARHPDLPWVQAGRLWGESVYACLMAVGASHDLATLAQVAVIPLAAILVWRAFRPPRPVAGALPILLAASFLAAPHSIMSDSVLTTIAIVLWMSVAPATPRPAWHWILALTIWLIPILSPPLYVKPAALIPVLLAGFIIVALRHPQRVQPSQQGPSQKPRPASS